MKNILRLGLPLWSAVFNFWRKKVRCLSHQRLDMHRTHEKWELMMPLFENSTGSLLDLGCNEGYFSLQAAKMGWTVTGIDIDEEVIQYANRAVAKAGKQDSVTYKTTDITPEVLHSMPKFDSALMLSMFQEIYFHQGGENAKAVMGEVLDHCQRFLVFETATTNIKYSNTDIVFAQDNDQKSITQWVESLAGIRSGWTVRFWGRTAYTNEEPYRLMYLFERESF